MIVPIIFNHLGAIFFGAGFFLFIVSSIICPSGDVARGYLVPMQLAGLVMVILDEGYRLYTQIADFGTIGFRFWFHPEYGGHVWFVPVWLLGIVIILLGYIAYDHTFHQPNTDKTSVNYVSEDKEYVTFAISFAIIAGTILGWGLLVAVLSRGRKKHGKPIVLAGAQMFMNKPANGKTNEVIK